MLVTLPYFSGDLDQAIRLANWIRDLGGVANHDCLLVIDRSTIGYGVFEPLQEAFRSVQSIPSDPAGAQGSWGTGTTDATAANQMWMTANIFIYHKLKVPFFWMEPDAVPTRSTWLDELEAEYLASGKKFMGAHVNIPPHEPHMSGVSCYPFNVADHSLAMMDPPRDAKGGQMAWDYAGRRDTVEKAKAHFTDLIQHEYRINGESPTFPTVESLAVIRPRTAVFHRCKDESLIQRIREKKEGDAPCLETSHRTSAMNTPSTASNGATTVPPAVAPDPIIEIQQTRIRELEAILQVAADDQDEQGIQPQTMADQMRGFCRSLAAIVGDKPGRRAQAQTFLREVALMGPARMRRPKRRKA